MKINLSGFTGENVKGVAVSDLVAWLNAQIDHDDLTRREALEHLLDGGRHGFDWSGLPDPVRVFVMTWTPGRAELEVAAYRRILAALRLAESRQLYYERDGEEPFASESRAFVEAMKQAVRTIAAIYSDREGFDPAWAVE